METNKAETNKAETNKNAARSLPGRGAAAISVLRKHEKPHTSLAQAPVKGREAVHGSSEVNHDQKTSVTQSVSRTHFPEHVRGDAVME